MKESKKEQVSKILKERVLTLDLKPATTLDETALCGQYGLSRTPLREVFQRLAGEGYLSLESNRGATVSSMDMNTMRAFFQSAPMIYAAVARLATEHAIPAQINRLKDIQSKFRKSVNNDATAEMAVQNHLFHEQLGVMAASPYLMPSLGRLLIDHTRMSHRFYRVQSNNARPRINEACEQHDLMIESIANGDSAITVELTLKHWELSRTEIDKYVFPDPLPIDTAAAVAEIV